MENFKSLHTPKQHGDGSPEHLLPDLKRAANRNYKNAMSARRKASKIDDTNDNTFAGYKRLRNMSNIRG